MCGRERAPGATATRGPLAAAAFHSYMCGAPANACALIAVKQTELDDMHSTTRVQTPPRIATEAFTDAAAAVARLEDIYERNARFLRDRFEAYANGEVLV